MDELKLKLIQFVLNCDDMKTLTLMRKILGEDSPVREGWPHDGRMTVPTDTNSDSYKKALKILLRDRENLDYDEGINSVKAVIGAAKDLGWYIAVDESAEDFEGITIGTKDFLARNLKDG